LLKAVKKITTTRFWEGNKLVEVEKTNEVEVPSWQLMNFSSVKYFMKKAKSNTKSKYWQKFGGFSREITMLNVFKLVRKIQEFKRRLKKKKQKRTKKNLLQESQ